VVILEDFEVMWPPANRRALVNDDARRRADHKLFARVALLLPGIIALALGRGFRFALGLLDAIDDEGQFGICLSELLHRADPLLAALLFFVRQFKNPSARRRRHRQDRLEDRAHQLDGATDDAFIFGTEEQRHKLLGEIEPIVEEQHQQPLRERVLELRAATNLAQAFLAGADDFAFALAFTLLIDLLEPR
jgi:hypothetical protein